MKQDENIFLKETPNYYAIIPANVRYDKNLPLGAKLMFGEINALRHKEGYCWASNKYFSDLYAVSNQTIQNWISALKTAQYINVETQMKQSGSFRKIYVNESKPMFFSDSE